MSALLGIGSGVASMVGYGLSNVAAKPLASSLGSNRAIAYRQILVATLLGGVACYMGGPAPLDASAVGYTVLVSILGYLPLLLFFQGLRIGKVGIISALTQAKIIVTASLSVLFLAEGLSVIQILGLLLVFAGLVALSLSRDEMAAAADNNAGLLRLARGAGYALSAGVLWGVVFFLFKFCVSRVGPWVASFVIELTVLCCSALHVLLTEGTLRTSGVTRNTLLLVLAGAISAAFGTLFFNVGITYSNVSVVCTFTFSAAAVSAVAGWIFLGERLDRRQIISVAAVIAGVVCVSAG